MKGETDSPGGVSLREGGGCFRLKRDIKTKRKVQTQSMNSLLDLYQWKKFPSFLSVLSESDPHDLVNTSQRKDFCLHFCVHWHVCARVNRPTAHNLCFLLWAAQTGRRTGTSHHHCLYFSAADRTQAAVFVLSVYTQAENPVFLTL